MCWQFSRPQLNSSTQPGNGTAPASAGYTAHVAALAAWMVLAAEGILPYTVVFGLSLRV